MSSDVALQAMFDRFLGRFVLPLIRGGDVLVSYPLGAGALEYFRFAEPTEPSVSGEIVKARQAVLEELVPSPLPEDLTEQDIDLLAALHNVLLCCHQEVVSGFHGKARWGHCLAWAMEHFARVSPCTSPESALSRHSLLHQVTSLERVDTVLHTRRSTKRYLGQQPPPRALIWPRFRKLRQTEEVVGFREVVAVDEARAAQTAILESSPLTCLLSMPYLIEDRPHQAELRWTPEIVMTLSRPDLCRCVTYRHLSLGFPATGPHLARALLAELGRGQEIAGDPRLAFGLRYVLNLQLTHCWSAGLDDLERPLEPGWGEPQEEPRRYFFGWFAAALAREDRVAAPAPTTPELRERETRYRSAAAAVAGPMLEHAARHVDLLVPPWQHIRQEARTDG